MTDRNNPKNQKTNGPHDLGQITYDPMTLEGMPGFIGPPRRVYYLLRNDERDHWTVTGCRFALTGTYRTDFDFEIEHLNAPDRCAAGGHKGRVHENDPDHNVFPIEFEREFFDFYREPTMTTNQSATEAAAAKVAKPKKGAKVSHAKTVQEQGALPLPTSYETAPEFAQMRISDIAVLDQVRKEFDDAALQDLAMDISYRGILQPLTVRRNDDGYVLVAGERRLRAARLAQLDSVPVLIVSMDEKAHALAQLAENIQREDLNLKEEAAAIKLLFDELGNVQAVGAKVHKSKSWVSKRLSLANGLGYWASMLMTDGITEDIELLQTVDKLDKETTGTNACWALCEKIKKGEAGREDAREALRRAKEERPAGDTKPKVKKPESLYPAADQFLAWCKQPNRYNQDYIEFAFSIIGADPHAEFIQTINKIAKLEKELNDTRNARDTMLNMAGAAITESMGAIAIDAAMAKFFHDDQDNTDGGSRAHEDDNE